MHTTPHQKARADLTAEQFAALTQEEAIEITLERMADMFEALNAPWEDESQRVPSRPTRPDEPAHLTLVRWGPILSDYGHFARRANLASKAADEAKRDRDQQVQEARQRQYRAEDESRKAVRTLGQARSALREALSLIGDEDD